MFRFIVSAILIGISVTAFFVFTNPLYKDISLKRKELASYDEALGNSKAFKAERDKLVQKSNAFDPNNLDRLVKLLPDNIDNIRLILEIEKLAKPYNMKIKDVKYSDVEKKDDVQKGVTTQNANTTIPVNKDYGIWNLEFSTEGTYNNFTNFVKDIENNLRIVDISSISFSSNENTGLKSFSPDTYKYNFKIKTYWLKN